MDASAGQACLPAGPSALMAEMASCMAGTLGVLSSYLCPSGRAMEGYRRALTP